MAAAPSLEPNELPNYRKITFRLELKPSPSTQSLPRLHLERSFPPPSRRSHATPSAAPQLLLIGATAFIGFMCLGETLSAGHSVRCVVGSNPEAEKRPGIKAMLHARHDLSLEIVVDSRVVKEEWMRLLQDAEYVIHIAAPKPRVKIGDWTSVPEATFMDSAGRITSDLLDATEKAEAAERVVIKSSVAASGAPDEDPKSITFGVEMSGSSSVDGRIQHTTSKIAVANAGEFIATHKKVKFHIINIMPGSIFGRSELLNTGISLLCF